MPRKKAALPYEISKGSASPYGVTAQPEGINFAVYVKNAKALNLCFFDDSDLKHATHEIKLDPEINKTGDVWHIQVKNLPAHFIYAYRLPQKAKSEHYYLLDPYAKAVASPPHWRNITEKQDYQPRGKFFSSTNFDWENDAFPNLPKNKLIVYEMHVRGFTNHPSSQVQHPGTFLGLIEKIPYLKELGINAIELMPINEFNELGSLHKNPITNTPLYNYFGYSTVNFFAPMNRYCSQSKDDQAVNEFKMMVKELHKNGIEIILDVVFNHTSEGNERGPVISFKGLDHETFYLIDKKGHYLNFSGCGNTLNCNDPLVVEFILSVLRYWVMEMHIDGFRFDLASIFTRGENGAPLDKPPIVEAMSKDPVLANTKLIAEAWDAGGLYQLGLFAAKSNRWSEWNGAFRDGVRRFIKGTGLQKHHFAQALTGSFDIYKFSGTPCSSVNFVTCHDGFSLYDLVSYNGKHNEINGEGNRDGMNENDSWNCGAEGKTDNKEIVALRDRQMRNFLLALLVSSGIPMLFMGDEYAHTKKGNNNTWAQDNDLNWFNWENLNSNSAFYRFYRALIQFRKNEPLLNRETFFGDHDITWHGIMPLNADWENDNKFLAFTLNQTDGAHEIYAAFNASHLEQEVTLPSAGENKKWGWIVNTSSQPPNDFYENPVIQESDKIKMLPYSSVLLKISV